MSFLARIFVDDQEREILNADYLFYKTKSLYGKPDSEALGGQLDIALESTANDNLWFDWMFSTELRKKGHIRFYNRDGLSKLFDFEFWDCYCTGLHESFRANGPMPMTLKLSLSPGIFRIRDYIYEKPWKISDPFSKNEAVAGQSEEEQEIFEPRIVATFVNLLKISNDNKCVNGSWLHKLGTNVRPDQGNFNGIEIQFFIEGDLGTEYHTEITRMVTYQKERLKKENVVESKDPGSFEDKIRAENKHLKPTNGKIYAIDGPGFHHGIATKAELSDVFGIELKANFRESATIFNSKGDAVSTKSVEWHSFIKITRESTSRNFKYKDGKIGEGAIYGKE